MMMDIAIKGTVVNMTCHSTQVTYIHVYSCLAYKL